MVPSIEVGTTSTSDFVSHRPVLAELGPNAQRRSTTQTRLTTLLEADIPANYNCNRFDMPAAAWSVCHVNTALTERGWSDNRCGLGQLVTGAHGDEKIQHSPTAAILTTPSSSLTLASKVKPPGGKPY
jgi:hypothetical protein